MVKTIYTKKYNVTIPRDRGSNVAIEIDNKHNLKKEQKVKVRFDDGDCKYEIIANVKGLIEDGYYLEGKTLIVTEGIEW